MFSRTLLSLKVVVTRWLYLKTVVVESYAYIRYLLVVIFIRLISLFKTNYY